MLWSMLTFGHITLAHPGMYNSPQRHVHVSRTHAGPELLHMNIGQAQQSIGDYLAGLAWVSVRLSA